MNASTSVAIQVAVAVAMLTFTAYAAGRVHQWYRHGFEREVAYREGYNEASHALFRLATRSAPVRLTPGNPHETGPTRLPCVGVS